MAPTPIFWAATLRQSTRLSACCIASVFLMLTGCQSTLTPSASPSATVKQGKASPAKSAKANLAKSNKTRRTKADVDSPLPSTITSGTTNSTTGSIAANSTSNQTSSTTAKPTVGDDRAKAVGTPAAPKSNDAPVVLPQISPHNLPSTHIYNSLMRQAAHATQQGLLSDAAQLYKQALGLRPNSTAAYARLSALTLQQGNAQAAEHYARSGLLLAKNHTAQRGFWQLIALALTAQHKPKEAAAARAQAARLQ